MKSQGDLYVDARYLETLAKEQSQASGEITAAKQDPSEVVGKLTWDHGPVCLDSIDAMEAMDGVRERAAANMATVSDLLSENLITANRSYTTTDEETGGNIDKQVIS